MSVLSSAEKWDLKYAECDLNTPAEPCYVLQQHSGLLPFNGRALDYACGLGGNARFLARCGLKTDAWDISDNALTLVNNYASLHHLPITPLITDLEQMLLPYQQFDVIVVCRYLDRNQFKALEDALKPNGLLFYQTFLGPVQDNAPNNADFYLKSGELPKTFNKLQTLVYGEGWLANETDAGQKARYAWFVGRKPA